MASTVKRNRKLRERIGKCQECGATEDLTADHKIPLARGGRNHLPNIWILCQPCNNNKANLTVEEWRAVRHDNEERKRLVTEIGAELFLKSKEKKRRR